MAQATLALMIAEATSAATAPERDTAKPTGGLLAGVDEAQFDESLLQAPPRPGDRFVAGCEVLGRFGRLSKVAAWMERDGVRVATATMLLASG